MSEWETLREAAEIMEREGYPGAGNARRLGSQLQTQAVRDERDEALAKALRNAWHEYAAIDTERSWLPIARAARSHIAAEGLAPGGYVTRPGDPAPLTVEPPVGSVVRDSDGDEWTRYVRGWDLGCKGPASDWDVIRRLYGPLTLVSTPEETA